MLNSLGLGFVFTARDMASGQIHGLSTAFGALDHSVSRTAASYHRNVQVMAVGLGVLGAGAAVLGGALGLAEMAGHFEQALARLGGVSRATTAEMQALHDTAIQVGVATMFDPTEAVEGLTALAEKGFTAREQMQLIMPAAQLAEGGAMEIATAAEAMSAAVRVFGQDAAQAADDADMMLASQQTSALQARDMVQAFAGVSRGASLTHQSLSEMLIAMGFVRDTGADVSVSATSVSSALVFMASRAKKFKEIGVDVTDAQGNFRPFLDIVRESSVALAQRFPNAADRTANALQLFSRFGLQAYAATTANLERGIRTTSGQILHGAQAIDYLRERFAAAARDNAAEEFQHRLLNTFAGQQRLLRGSFHTLGIIVGEGFTRAFRPYVESTIHVVNRLIAVFQDMSIETRAMIGHVVLVGGALTMGAGAFIAAAAAAAIVAPFIGAITEAALGLAAGLAPVIAAMGVLTLVYFGFQRAIEGNIGGLGAQLSTFFDNVKLGVQALGQLFTQGGFSGAIRDSLDEGHVGLRRFVINIYQIGFRVVQFFRGVWLGFTTAIDHMGPTFERLSHALTRLGESFGFVRTGVAGVADMNSTKFADAGARIGTTIGGIVDGFARFLTIATEVVTGVVIGWKQASGLFEVSGTAIGDSLSYAGDQISELLVTLGLMTQGTDSNTSGWVKFGRVVGGIIVFVASLVGTTFAAINFAVGLTARFVDQLVQSFQSLYNVVSVVWQIMSGILGKGSIGDTHEQRRARESHSFDMLGSLVFGAGQGASRDEQNAGRAGADIRDALFGRQLRGVGGGELPSPRAASVEARARSGATTDDALARVAQMYADQRKTASAPTIVNVHLDGEKIATATARADRARGAASGRPVPAEE